MIESYVITVHEIDDPDDAVALVREKLSGIKLKRNSMGIISAHPDVVYSGVYKAVCNALPFPVAGIACDDQCANGEIGLYMFSIMILTGDECGFATGHADNMSRTDDAVDELKECYHRLKSQLDGRVPKLALMYTHFKQNCVSCDYIEAVSEIDPTVAVFGSVANAKDTFESRNGALTLCGCDALDDSVVLVLIAGAFTPKFFVSTFNEQAVVLKDVGAVSKADKNMLYEIDGKNAADFLDNAGLSKVQLEYSNSNSELMSTAFVLNYGDRIEGSKRRLVSRQPVTFTDDGVLCAGHISVGARISVAFSTPDSVAVTAAELVEDINKSGGKTALMYSCIGRQVGLLNNPMKEFEIIRTGLTADMNYVATYAYGEISPALVTEEQVYNYSHNQTLIACVF
jgi:hypothetical protein